ncbi:MAG TPA: Fur family transcriptional regulator [Planctomycetota bacterium]|nr:Fur family transcriptional regulator [Planctomycetota bacterium]
MTEHPQKELAIFQEYLKTRGLKLTSQRNVIAKKVLGTHKHFSAEELLEDLKGEKRAISKATVYRTLALLEESNLINSIDFQRGYKFYEHTHLAGHEHHEHIVCIECFKVIEFTDPELETFHDRIARRHNFSVVSHTYKIFGVCPACAARGKGPAPAEAGHDLRNPPPKSTITR